MLAACLAMRMRLCSITPVGQLQLLMLEALLMQYALRHNRRPCQSTSRIRLSASTLGFHLATTLIINSTISSSSSSSSGRIRWIRRS